MSDMPGPLEQAAIDAHSERWARQISKQGGFVLGYIAMQSMDPDRCVLDGAALHYGPVVEDAPPRIRGGMLLMLGGFMAINAPKVIAEADGLYDKVNAPPDPVTRYILTVQNEHADELFMSGVTLDGMLEAGVATLEKVTRP